jgi:hypothetical protein
MSNTINPQAKGMVVGPDQLAEGYAVKSPDLKQLDPLVSPPRLKDFEMRSPPLFPGVGALSDPAVSPPAGIDSLRSSQPSGDRNRPTSGVEVTLNRAAMAMEANAIRSEEGTSSVTEGTTIVESTDAAEAAAIARDQIRYEPRKALEAQANSTAQNVLSVLK